ESMTVTPVGPVFPTVAQSDKRPRYTSQVVFETARPGNVVAVLESREILIHVLSAPRRISGELGNVIPITILRSDCDHRVVCGATAKRSGAWIPNARLAVDLDHLRIVRLEFGIFIVTHEVIPLAVRIL